MCVFFSLLSHGTHTAAIATTFPVSGRRPRHDNDHRATTAVDSRRTVSRIVRARSVCVVRVPTTFVPATKLRRANMDPSKGGGEGTGFGAAGGAGSDGGGGGGGGGVSGFLSNRKIKLTAVFPMIGGGARRTMSKSDSSSLAKTGRPEKPSSAAKAPAAAVAERPPLAMSRNRMRRGSSLTDLNRSDSLAGTLHGSA